MAAHAVPRRLLLAGLVLAGAAALVWLIGAAGAGGESQGETSSILRQLARLGLTALAQAL